MNRLIALLIIVIPGIVAVYGFKLMRDTLFGVQHPLLPYLPLQFIVGLVAFLFGLTFVTGFVFHRDRKRNKVQRRFNQK